MQPEKIIQQFLIFIRQNSIIFLLVLFVFVDAVFAPAIYSQNNTRLTELSTLCHSCDQRKCPCGKKGNPDPYQNLDSRLRGNDISQIQLIQNSASKNIPKISQISGPRIDDGVASVERIFINSIKEKENFCSTLPTGIWTFLLLAYLGLLIFNLSYNFKESTRVQWGFELGLTLLAIVAWFVFDAAKCGASTWYPPLVLKTGILTYAIYLYFFDKKIHN